METNGQLLVARVAVLEAQLLDVRTDLHNLKIEELKDIKDEIRGLRAEGIEARRGLSRSEKIALWATGAALLSSVIAVLVMLIGPASIVAGILFLAGAL